MKYVFSSLSELEKLQCEYLLLDEMERQKWWCDLSTVDWDIVISIQ